MSWLLWKDWSNTTGEYFSMLHFKRTNYYGCADQLPNMSLSLEIVTPVLRSVETTKDSRQNESISRQIDD